MKLHLPHKLLAAVLSAMVAPTLYAEATESGSTYISDDLGNIMYVGDSITHGVNSASWRWAMHKIFADNGISHSDVGYKSGNYSGGVGTGTVYGETTFQNNHSSQASARAWELAGRKAGGRFDNTNLKNWLGQSTTKTGGGTYTGATYDVDTFYLLIGTNDLLSDGGTWADKYNALLGADTDGVRSGGDMKTIIDAMFTHKADANVTILSVPCWTYHNNNDGESSHAAILEYNRLLKAWIDNYNTTNGKSVLYVDTNYGMVDVASSTSFYGVRTMFNNPPSDGLHPSAQGDLLMAGNVAKQQGLAGRTGGQTRRAASAFSRQADAFVLTGDGSALTDGSVTLAAGGTATLSWGDVDLTDGMTLEFRLSNGLGNGATDGWDTSHDLSVSMGNGSVFGTLNINEAYIKWGGTILYSMDMSGDTESTAYTVYDTNESIRVAYLAGNPNKGLTAGYYVWLGDMLIGEACSSGGTVVDGITITNGTSATVTLTGLAATEGSYAPTTTLYTNGNPTIASFIPKAGTDPKTIGWTEATVTNDVSGGVTGDNQGNVIGLTANSAGEVVATVNGGAQGSNVYLNNKAHTGDIWVSLSGAFNGSSSYNGVQQGSTNTGDVYFCVTDGFKGTGAWGTWFGALNGGSITGDLYMEFSSGDFTVNSGDYSGVSASVAGAFGAGVGGEITMVFNDAKIKGNVYGGSINGSQTIGSTSVNVSGGTFQAGIFAGGSTGTISDGTAVTLNGDKYYLNGTTHISAGGTGGTISGGTVLTINEMNESSADADLGFGLCAYTGVLSGNSGATVNGEKKLVITDSTNNAFNAQLRNFDTVEITGSTIKLGADSTLGGAGVLKLTNSTLTLTAGTYEDIQVVTSGGKLVLEGANLTVSAKNNDSQAVGSFEAGSGSTLGLGEGYETRSSFAVKDGGALALANGVRLLGEVKLDSGSAVTVAENSTVVAAAGSLSGSLKLSGGGQLQIGEAATFSTRAAAESTTLDSYEGEGLVNNSTLTITSLGALTGSIENYGSLTIGGTIDKPAESVWADLYQEVETYSNASGQPVADSNNGYLTKNYYLVKSYGDATLSLLDGTTLADGLTNDGANLYFTTQDTATYYVNEHLTYESGADVYNVGAGSTILVSDGASLTLTTALTNSGTGLQTDGSGVVYLNNGTSTALTSLGTTPTGINLAVKNGDTGSMAYTLLTTTDGVTVEQGANLAVTAAAGTTLNLSKLAGSGTVELVSTGSGYYTLKADNTGSFSGTLSANVSNVFLFFSGEQALATHDADGNEQYVSLHLKGSKISGLGLNKSYCGTENALKLGSLSGDAGVSVIGEYGTDISGYRYLELHQNEDTTFAGAFGIYSNSSKGCAVGVVKYGEGTLTLSGANTSGADLRVMEGSVVLAETGAWAGDVVLGADASLVSDGGTKSLANITAPAPESADGNFGQLNIRNNTALTVSGAVSAPTVQIEAGSSVTVTTPANSSFVLSGLSTVAKEGAQDISINNAGAAMVSTATLAVAADTALSVSGDLKIGGTIQLDGSLSVGGKLWTDSLANLTALTDAEGNPVTRYVDRLSTDSRNNGYENTLYSVYTGEGTFSYSDQFIYVQVAGENAAPLKYDIDSLGQVRVGESNGRYFVNEGTVVYGADDNSAASDATAVIVLNGGTLELAQELGNAALSLASNSTLKIAEGVNISYIDLPVSDDPNTVLNVTGSGTIDLGVMLKFDHSGMTFGEDWTGKVRLSNFTFANTAAKTMTLLNDLPRGNGWVELEGCSGIFAGQNNEVNANLWLTNAQKSDGVYALNIAAASNGKFSGKLAGDGDIVINTKSGSNGSYSLELSGDISGWTGMFNYQWSPQDSSGNQGFKLLLSGEGDVNADMRFSSGTATKCFTVEVAGTGVRNISSDFSAEKPATQKLNLKLSGESTKNFTGDVAVNAVTALGSAATFSNALSANSLTIGASGTAGAVTIAAGATAELGAVNVTNGTLALSGTTTVSGAMSNSGTVNFNGTTSVAGALTNGGTMTFAANSATTLGGLTVNSGSTTTFAANSATTINGTLTLNADLTISAGTIASTAGLTKAGSGTLTIADNVDLQLSGLTISSGRVQLNTLGVSRPAVRLGDVTLNAGTMLEQWGNPPSANTYAHREVHMNSLTLNGNATLKQSQHNGFFDVSNLKLNGNTLTLNPTGPTSAAAQFVFRGTQAADDTAGVVTMNNGSRNVAISIASDEALQKSTLTVDNPSGTSYYRSVCIGTDNAHLLGLSGGANWVLVSTAATTAGNTSNSVDNLAGDGAARTLTITGTGTNTFSGSVGANLNIVMDGAGSQTFSGSLSNVNGAITANKGALSLGSDIGTTTSIAVASGATLSMKGGTVADLNVAGTLGVAADSTLSVTNTLTLGKSLNLAGTLAIGAGVSRIDLTGMTATNDGTTYALIAAGSTGSITGLPANGADLLSLLRVNGIGWTSASYENGVITLSRAGSLLVWETPGASDWTSNTQFTISGSESTAAANAESNVTFTENSTMNLVSDIALTGMDVDKTLTLTGDSKLTVSYINLEKNATMDASGITLETNSIDLSEGSTLKLGTVAGDAATYTGDGTVQVSFGSETGTVSMAADSTFTGTVEVTGGTANLSGSTISDATWKLSGTGNATLSGEVTKDIVLAGTTHNISVDDGATGTLAGSLSGEGATSGFSKTGAGALTLSGDTQLTNVTATAGALTLSGTATIDTVSVTGGTLTQSGTATIGDISVTGGTLTLSGTTTVKGTLANAGTLTLAAAANTTVNNLTNTGANSLTLAAGTTLTVNGTLDIDAVAKGTTLGAGKVGTATSSQAATAADITFVGGEGFVKAGNGALVLNGNKTTLSKTTITGGTLQLVSTQARNFGEITLNGGTFSTYYAGGTAPSAYHTISKLTVQSNDSKLSGVWHNTLLDIQGLAFDGATTLVIEDAHTSSNVSVYRFSGETTGSGTIEMHQADKDTKRNAAVSINGLNTLENVVVNYAESASVTNQSQNVNKARNIVAVSAGEVRVAGLDSAEGIADCMYLISRGDAASAVVYSNNTVTVGSDNTTRTLTITGNGSAHTFNGHVLGGLNIVMGDAATASGSVQSFTGNLDSFNGSLTVNKGTLNMTNTVAASSISATTVTLNGGTLNLANDATFHSLSGATGTTLASTAGVKTLTLTGEGGTFAGTLTNFNIDLHEGATGTHAFTGTVSGTSSIAVADGTLAIAGATTVTDLAMTGGSIADSGTITVNGSVTATGGSLANTSLVLGESCTVDADFATNMNGGSLTVNNGSANLTLTSASAMVLENLYTKGNLVLGTDLTVRGTLTLNGGGRITFDENRQMIYGGYIYTNLIEDVDGVINETAEGVVSVSGLRVIHQSAASANTDYDCKMTDVRFVNAVAGTTTLTAEGNAFTDIVVSAGKVVLAHDTTVSGDVELAVNSASLTVAGGASLSNGVITLTGLNNADLEIDNTTSNASVFNGGGEASAAIISGAAVTIKADGAPYEWGAMLTGDSTLTTTGDVTLSNTEANGLSTLTVNSGSLRLDGDMTVGTATVNGSLILAAAKSLTITDTLTNTLTAGGSITVKHNEGAASVITNTGASAIAIDVMSSDLEIADSQITVDANGGSVDTAFVLNNSTLEVINGNTTGGGGTGTNTVTATVKADSTNDFIANEGNVVVKVTEGGTTATVGSLTMTNTGTATETHTATFTTSDGNLADVKLTGTESRIDAGNTVEAKDVIVTGKSEESGSTGAVLTVSGSQDESAKVSGNLTVQAGGTLSIADSGQITSTSTPIVEVSGKLTLSANAVIAVERLDVGERIIVAYAQDGIEMDEAVQVVIAGVKLAAGSHVVLEKQVEQVWSAFSTRVEETPTPSFLTATNVANAVTSVGNALDNGVLMLKTNLTQSYIDACKAESFSMLEISVEDAFVQAIRDAAGGSIFSIALTDASGAVLDLTGLLVSLNGDIGVKIAEGAIDWSGAEWTASGGSYYSPLGIPEPATATLSLLALAALAARRRRK